MISFISRFGSRHFFKINSFDRNDLPIVFEVSFNGSKNKERILHVAVESKEQMKSALKVLPDFDGLHSELNIDMDLTWILPCANSLVYFLYHGKVQNLAYISQFAKLRYLSLKECKKALDLSKLVYLVEIKATKVDFSGFTFSPLANIRHFSFVNCQNISNIPLNKNTPLQYLSLIRDRDTKSLEFIKGASNLEIISLFEVSQLEHWPDSSQMTRLRRIYCTNTNRLFDYNGLAQAPNLECIHFGNRGLKPVHLEPFMACKSLKYMGFFGTKKETALVREMFPGILLDDDRPENCTSLGVFFSEDDWVIR